jgi:hypothetical protein
MAAADAYRVPFIAFRGISDTDAVGNLWPFEWLVYQGLAADNAGVAARLWISHWRGSHCCWPAGQQRCRCAPVQRSSRS